MTVTTSVRSARAGEGAAAAELVTAAGTRATVGLLTDGAAGYYDRFGFVAVSREQLPPGLSASPELTRLCPASALAYLRT